MTFNANNISDINSLLTRWYHLHDAIITGMNFSFTIPDRNEADFMPSFLQATIVFSHLLYSNKAHARCNRICAVFSKVRDVLVDWRSFGDSDWGVEKVEINLHGGFVAGGEESDHKRMALNIAWNICDVNGNWIVLMRPIFTFEEISVAEDIS